MENVTKLLSGKDNKTPDIVRVGIAVGAVSLIGLAAATVVMVAPVEILIAFATGYTMILGGGAAGLKIKETTEPDP